MKPYYEHKGITIYHGDCLEIMPELESVDLVVTDPPYGIQFVSNRRRIKYNKITGDDYLPLDSIKLAIDKAQNGAYIFCRWNNLTDMPKPKSVLVWIKNNWSAGDLKHEHGRQWEAICFYCGKKHKFIKRVPDVIFSKKTGNKLHPTEKPTYLFSKIIACNVGNVILDPFMGSGTTLAATKELGRRAIGIEIEEKNCEIAARRLQQEVLFT